MKYLKYLSALLIFPLYSSTVIYSSVYVDVINEVQVNNTSIIIDNNKITAIKKGFIDIDKNDELIDFRGYNLSNAVIVDFYFCP
jgi:dihydroorotase-like cyclic amidohydrolase